MECGPFVSLPTIAVRPMYMYIKWVTCELSSPRMWRFTNGVDPSRPRHPTNIPGT